MSKSVDKTTAARSLYGLKCPALVEDSHGSRGLDSPEKCEFDTRASSVVMYAERTYRVDKDAVHVDMGENSVTAWPKRMSIEQCHSSAIIKTPRSEYLICMVVQYVGIP